MAAKRARDKGEENLLPGYKRQLEMEKQNMSPLEQNPTNMEVFDGR